MKNFTFKKHPKETGLRSITSSFYTDIKLYKKVCGLIVGRGNHFKIRFMIKKEKTNENPSSFKWVFLKKECSSEEEARNFVKRFHKEIQEKYDLYLMEDD